jgi:hypothetical protein
VWELLQGRRAQREAQADRRQARHAGGLPARRGGQDLPGPGPAGEGVQQHRADMVRLEACSKRLPTKLTSRVSAGQTIKKDHLRVLE